MAKAYRYIFNWIFLCSLCILILNDHYLKAEYGNWVTGKLSDIFGLIVFAWFFTSLVPNFKKAIFYGSAVMFSLWKLPLSQPIINTWNYLPFWTIERTVDYTDILCIVILWPLYFWKPVVKTQPVMHWKKWALPPLLTISLVAIVATSRYQPLRQKWIYLDDQVRIKGTKDAFIRKMNTLGFKLVEDGAKITPPFPHRLSNEVANGHYECFVFGRDTSIVTDNISANWEIISLCIWEQKKHVLIAFRHVALTEDIAITPHSKFRKAIRKEKRNVKTYFKKLHL